MNCITMVVGILIILPNPVYHLLCAWLFRHHILAPVRQAPRLTHSVYCPALLPWPIMPSIMPATW